MTVVRKPPRTPEERREDQTDAHRRPRDGGGPSGARYGRLVPMRVLVGDDEEAVRTAVRRALTLAGYDVELAADGEEALASLAERAPDAIVLDILMPGVDGIEVCRRVRGAGDHSPVLMLTARDAVGDRVAGLDAGAGHCMVKPFALQDLLA